DNDTIKVYRSGGADPDGNQPGDLYVTIKVNNSIPVYWDELANLTQRQQILMEEFAKEEQQELEKGSTAAGASG
ncbi:hypothetical protein GW17_00010057, partial [Ensete ventricosum]